MRRGLLFCTLFLLVLLPTNVFAASTEIYIDEKVLECDSDVKNIDGRVLVPMRAIFEGLDIDVAWDSDNRTVIAERNGEIINVPIDDNFMDTGIRNSDGEVVWIDKIELDVPAQIFDDFTYVPVRAVSESIGAKVSWDGERSRVYIDTQTGSDKNVYFTSNADYQKLYSVKANSSNRTLISNKSVCELEISGEYVYYLTSDDQHLYRANAKNGEEEIIARPIKKIAVENEWVYYTELDETGKNGVMYKMNTETRKIMRLTDRPVQYPEKHGDYIYFIVENEAVMYGISLDGNNLVTLMVDNGDVTLYPFNCLYHSGYFFAENGVGYGNIIRLSPDGRESTAVNSINSLICKRQPDGEMLLFTNQDDGKAVYCMNIDGSDMHLVVKGDESWVNIEPLAKIGNVLYYKNPTRMEVYRINIDGSDKNYVCYADDVKSNGEKLVTSYNGLYIASPDGSNLNCIYNRNVDKFDVDDVICFTDKQSGKLYISDFLGNVQLAINDSVNEWVFE